MKGNTARYKISHVPLLGRPFLFWESDSTLSPGTELSFVPTWLRALVSGLAARDDLIRKWLEYLLPSNEAAPAQQLRWTPPRLLPRGMQLCFDRFCSHRTWKHGRLCVSRSIQGCPSPSTLTLSQMENLGIRQIGLPQLATSEDPTSHWPPRKPQNCGVGRDPLGSRRQAQAFSSFCDETLLQPKREF